MPLGPLVISAAQINLPLSLQNMGWHEVTFDKKVPNKYSSCGIDCVRVVSKSSVSMIARSISNEITVGTTLSWSWKISKPVVSSDITVKGGDDRALALYITFPFDSETATLTERMLRPIVELIEGPTAPSRVLSYVWTGYGNTGELYPSPFYGDVNVMMVRRNATAPLKVWLHESVNIMEDHKRAFGSKPKRIAQILIGADTDDLQKENTGFVKNIKFLEK